jgi:hypothetical protein
MRTFLMVTVNKCSWGGMACCWKWSEVGHVLAELGDEVVMLVPLGRLSESVVHW